MIEHLAGLPTGTLAQPDGIVEAVAADDADRGEKAEGLAYEGFRAAWHGCVVRKVGNLQYGD